ncbi:MAG TPA: DUF5916 domain-containing protein [Thermoanaerobaculia bacterium]|nr:DUF5916 domain-containing protein [Thermoanaerobaculia bacterium]
MKAIRLTCPGPLAVCLLFALSSTLPAAAAAQSSEAGQETPEEAAAESQPAETPETQTEEAPPAQTPEEGSPPEQTAAGPRQRFGVARATSDIIIDGRLDEPAWEQASPIPVGFEWYPGENTPAPVETDCLVTYDEANLYVAFRAHDPEPGAVRAFYADRDTPNSDDTVGFFIDAFDDRRRAFYFQVNPLGIQTDAVVADFRPVTEVGPKVEKLQRLDYSWDALWDSAGRITESGYVVELAIPFKQLRFPRTREPQTWGFLASREYSRDVFHQLRSGRVDRSKNCFVCQFDAISGLEDMETGLNVEVVPTLTATRADTRASQSAPLTEGDEDSDLGVSARWSITPNVVLGAALNPDFSQVETDTIELAVNERFALQFPERRPFFLEGADFFETPFEAVFTRTVADPEYGLRLTGKGGPNAYGVMFTEDQLNNLVLPGPERSVQRTLVQDVTGSILRYRRDLGETSTLGLLYTGREGTDYENQVVGLDANWRVTESNTLRTHVMASDTSYPRQFALANRQPTDSFDGTAFLVDWSHSTRDWRWVVGAGELAPEFRADSGFIPQVGVRETGGFIQRFFWGGEDSWYQRLTVHVDALYQQDAQTERVLQKNSNVQVFYEGPRESVVRFAFRPNNESLRGRMFTNMRSDLLMQVRPRGDLGLELFVRGGETIDTTNVRQVTFLQIRPRVDFQLGKSFFGDVQYNRQVFEVSGRHRPDDGGEYQRAATISSTLRYHFTPRMFVRAIVQHRDVERDLSLYNPGATVRPEEESIVSQFLFSYKLNARTLVFLGYSQDELGDQNFDLSRQEQAYFFKVSYAFLW